MSNSVRFRLTQEHTEDENGSILSFDEAMFWIMEQDLNTYFVQTELYRPLLYRIAFHILGNHHNAEDVVQDTLNVWCELT